MTQTLPTRPSKPEWVRWKNAYQYRHPDPAIDQRFSIERDFIKGRKEPYFRVCDTLSKARGSFDRLRAAQKNVDKQIEFEAENPDIRVGVANDIARGDITKAFMRIIDYVDGHTNELREAVDRDFDELRNNLRGI